MTSSLLLPQLMTILFNLKDKTMQNQTLNFSDKISFKAPVISFVTYLLATMIATAVLIQIWMPAGMPIEQVAQLAETDPFVTFWGGVIGLVTCTLCAMLTTKLSKQTGLKNAVAFGGLLILYGIASIVLHPEHSLLHQVSKVLSPIPVAIFGGYIYLKLVGNKS